MSSIKKSPGAGSAFKNAKLPATQQTQTQAQTPAVKDARAAQREEISKFSQRTADDPAMGQVAAQMGADGKILDADGNPLKGNALLAARLDAMKQTAEPSVNPFPDTGDREPPQPSVNPFPDTGVTTAPDPAEPSVNPFPDTGVTTAPDPAEPSVNPFPDTGVTTEPEPAEPSVNPFPDVTPSPGPDIAINPIPDGRVPNVDDDES